MKQVLVIRKDLNMRKGKMVAQGAHASMAAILEDVKFKDFDYGPMPGGGPIDLEMTVQITPEIRSWLSGLFTKICVSVDSEEELIAVYDKAKAAGLPCSLIKDSGLTEFNGVPTYTAVAVGPGKPDYIDEFTGHLKLL